MTNSQKIQLRQSEVRERLNVLSGLEGDAFTEEKRAESERLGKEYNDLEARFRAAIVAESKATAPLDREGKEGAEIRGLVKRSSLSSYIGEALNQTDLSGSSPEVELRAALIGEDAQPGFCPWVMLAPSVLDDRDEIRQTDTETALASSVDVPSRQNQILGRVFAASALDFIRVQTTSVPTGTAAWPVLSAGTTALQRSPAQRIDATAATFEATAIEPTRVSARYLFRIEDLAKLRGMEESLRADLRGAIADQMDSQVLTGNGTSPNVSGLLSALTAPSDPSDVFTWVDAVKSVAAQVDGKYAASPAQVRMLADSQLYRELAVSLHATASVSAASRYIESISGGIRVSANLPAPTASPANIATALISRTAQVGAVAPVWEGLRLTRDPYTEAATGRVVLQADALWNFRVVRSNAYNLVKFKTA